MKKGKMTVTERKPSTGTIVWSLTQLTVCRIVESGRRKGAVYSNWNSTAREVFANIRSNCPKKRIPAAG